MVCKAYYKTDPNIIYYPECDMDSALATVSIILVSLSLTASYNIGLGRADITGPAAEIGMMGYAKFGQRARGIHTRLYSRAFIVQEDVDTDSRVVFVSLDAAMVGRIVKRRVVAQLAKLYPGLYTEKNIVLCATHTHSGPAGFMQYFIYNLVNLGFTKQTMEAMVAGITLSIVRAHTLLKPGYIFLSETEVEEQFSINRSPNSYDANPKEERAKYTSNVDTRMVQLNFYNLDNEPLGVLNWFAVHPTSMNNSNHFISGDNKGIASLLLEKSFSPYHLAGQTPFVAGFASTNMGDVSPNILGPRCQDTGLHCDNDHSTCNLDTGFREENKGRLGKTLWRTEMCVASGPGKDMFESTRIIASHQYNVSLNLLKNRKNQTKVFGPVQYIHQWVDLSNVSVTLPDNSKDHTCKPALGISFAAGTTDGPSDFDFTQGSHGHPFLLYISRLLKKPTVEQIKCHHPKPILLNTGEFTLPFAKHPVNIDLQIIRIGQVIILAVPGEFTTMAGRRLREAVGALSGLPGGKVVIAGPSNSYTHYITTWEEYQRQRYEASSTLFGPHTLSAYIQEYTKLVQVMLAGDSLVPGTPPSDLTYFDEVGFLPGVIFDSHPPRLPFGHCLIEPFPQYLPGDSVSATFVSGHLKNNLMLEETFLTVEKFVSDSWVVIARDTDWETKLLWTRTNILTGESTVEVIWDIPQHTHPGTYRLGHTGFYKDILIGELPYQGWSSTFRVLGLDEEQYPPRSPSQVKFQESPWSVWCQEIFGELCLGWEGGVETQGRTDL